MRKATLFSILLLLGCGPSTPSAPTEAEVAPVLENYAAILRANYEDSVEEATALDEALAPLTTGTATEAALATARTTWTAARLPYMETEAARFYGGPIDDEAMGYEGRINSWPMDEAFVDYVVDGEGEVVLGGLIHDTTRLPTIDGDAIAALNQVDSEESVATGWHAIEFILWGQDLSSSGPGARSIDDFVVGAGTDVERRRAYLAAVSELLVRDLSAVRDAWAEGAPYRAEFEGLAPEEGLRRILFGMGSLAGAELAGERINVAYTTQEQEDEHSCFSDTTLNDHLHDAIGIRNLYLGSYTRTDGTVVSGASVSSLVAARDAALDARVREELDAAVEAIEAIPGPFDQAILGADTTPGRVAIVSARQALRTLTSSLVEVADLLGVTLNLES